jgi:hypothetical protein
MTTESDLRLLKQQVTLLNAAVHALCAVLSNDQKLRAIELFEPATQFVQAKLEASTAPDEELNFLVGLRESLRAALLRQSPSQDS